MVPGACAAATAAARRRPARIILSQIVMAVLADVRELLVMRSSHPPREVRSSSAAKRADRQADARFALERRAKVWPAGWGRDDSA